MKTPFIRNSFVTPRSLAFSDKLLEASRNRKDAGDASMSFEYSHGSPSYPDDVLTDGNRRGYIAPKNDGTPEDLQEFTVTASGSVDDQASISVSGGEEPYTSASGAGVPIEGAIQVRGAGYHDVSVTHINIAYPPKNNVSFIHCSLSGIVGADPVPEDNEPESLCEDSCSCSFEGMETEGGGSAGEEESRLRSAGGYTSTSGGSGVTRSASANKMSWSCRFGSFRGLAGLPVGRLEILARQYEPSVSTPAGLALRHPFAMFLSIPEGGITPNQLVCLNDGASYTNDMCGASGEDFFTVGASQSSQTLLAPVSALSLEPSAACPLASAQYIRASYTNGYAVFFSPQTGECVAFVSRFGNVMTAQEAQDYLAIVREGETGIIRQVWNLWDGLADIVPNASTGGYTIAIYPPAQVTPPTEEGGLYTTSGNPVKTFTVTGDEEAESLTIAERDWALPESMPDFVYSWNYTGNAWSTVTGTGEEAIVQSRTRTELEDDEYSVETVISQGGVEAAHTLEVYKGTDEGKLLLSSTKAYGTDDPLTTTYSYNDQGQLISEIQPNGATTTYRYDRQGRLTKVSSPWGANGTRCIETTYRTDADPYSSEPAQVKTLLLTNTSLSTLRTDAYTYTSENGIKRVEVRSTAAGTAGTQLTVTETYEGDVENTFARGRVRMSQAVNGVQTWYEYATTDYEGALYTKTVETRVNGAPVPGQSTRTVNYISCEGNTIRSEKFVLLADGTWAKISGETSTYDVQNRLTGTVQDNGRSMSQALNCQGDLLWQIDEDGVRTDYAYNSARQLIETTRSEVSYEGTVITPETITEYTRDAAGHALTTTTHTGAMTTVTHTAYDLAGRVVSQTDVLGRVTTTAYAENGNLRTVTLPTGATLISALNPDGSVAHEYGTGQRELYYTYDFINGLRETVKLADNTTVLSQTITDGYGQTITRTAPTTLANTYLYTRSVYNTLGQLTKQTQGSLAPTTYAYNSMGQVSRQTVLLAAASPADATKNRITDYAYSYEQLEDGIYQVTTSTAHNATGGDLVTVQKSLVSRLSSTLAAKTIFIDVRGNVSTQRTEYTAPNVRTTYADIPTSDVTATALSVDGFTITATDNTDVTTSSTRAWTETGMLLTATDAAGFTTTTVYCADSNQPSIITNALGKTSCYRYDLRDRKIAEFGTAMQPALFEYDEAGNLTALTTFRVDDETLSVDPAGRTDGDTTRWDYDPATGLELVKTYPDNTQVLTTYDAMNRVASVTNARGIVQNRAYATASGLLTAITFSDSTIPQSFAYNILGQLTQVTDAAGTRSFTYNDYTEPLTDSVRVNTTDFPIVESYDAFGRSSGYILKRDTNARQSIAYTYDTKGQFSTCSFLHSGAQKTFTYQYLPGTHLLSSLTAPNNVKRIYTYKEKRDLIATLNDKRGNTAVVNRSYEYNALGVPTNRTIQRQGKTRNDVFTHNERSELTAATMGDKAFAYDYDNIGNRKTAQEEANDFTYTANALNQYTEITENEVSFTPAFDADGNQTRIKTTTGIWTAVYNALNRPLTFTRENADGTLTVITADYDYMGRRVFKKVETVATDSETGEETRTVVSNHRFLYRGYLQIDTLDLTRTTLNDLRFITWDPTETFATRPLAIQQSGTWYTYGLDLPKNVTELYNTAGGIATAYTYSPYGLVTSTGNVTQPLQWSCEYHDTDLALVYYNYRHYNPLDGRWLGRDSNVEEEISNLYQYVSNRPSNLIDLKGLQTRECVSYKNNSEIIDAVREEFPPLLQWIGDRINIWQLLKEFDTRAKVGNYKGLSTTVVLENLDLLTEGGSNSYTIIRKPLGSCISELCFSGRGFGGMKNKGERNQTGKASGTPSPFKHMKPHPNKKDQVITKDYNGKQVSIHKPEGFDEYWKGKHR